MGAANETILAVAIFMEILGGRREEGGKGGKREREEGGEKEEEDRVIVKLSEVIKRLTWVSCVVLPEPVSPTITITLLSRITLSSCSKRGGRREEEGKRRRDDKGEKNVE